MEGMQHIDLRDWFAGQALVGILANSQYPTQASGEPFDQFAGKVTDSAYKIAESMIKQGRRMKKDMTAGW
jgi:hypothetical protein